MATTTPLCFSACVSPRCPGPHSIQKSLISLSRHRLPGLMKNRSWVRTRALGGDMLGEFGARDPFPAEIESGFGEKVLGNVDTEHKILIPDLSALSLARQHCSPVPPSQPPMSEEDAQKLLNKVVGWRILDEEGALKLQCLWKLRDFRCGLELVNRIYKVAEAAGHFPNLHLEHPNQVRAELWTASIGGLSMNDFIVAAKIDKVETSDLVPKKRIWA
ncbi:probable pterin-4-alpha-carbinolamine dehydratase, chloroplastic [Malania oleifera]|uniref:probable pterin-4-alpha-carbinolamine dehydratase, chloroplastic n=1 Tax=Malania oleifera TaxID=397392 RepID=UPI0025ADA9A1|nr:probable pterin-4-alpha-carbinolamine dehydratase, chloroplastic [Malania oleifera]